ncbi:MAG TPA: glycosyltransferase, partial [Dehalococcoidia bacterium]|nr:glycosyltransferase [Dehalococcoidia bacterium]
MLDGALTSLQHQSLPADQYEILVIDNASTDDTAEVVKRHQAWSSRIRYFYEPKLGISNARNRAIAEAEAPIIAYTDDDACADAGWLEAVLAAFTRTAQRPLAVGGRIALGWGSLKRPRWLPDTGLLTLGSLDHGDASIPCRYAYDLFGSNLAFERAYLAASGGFNCRLGRTGANLISGEETEMLARLHADGGLLLYEPAAQVTHL